MAGAGGIKTTTPGSKVIPIIQAAVVGSDKKVNTRNFPAGLGEYNRSLPVKNA